MSFIEIISINTKYVYVSIDFFQINQQQARQRRVTAPGGAAGTTIETSTVIIFVSRYVRGSSGSNSREMELENITPRPLPNDSLDEQREFRQAFNQQVVDLIREFRRNFPYRQTIEWTIEYGNDNEHEYTLHIVMKPPRSTNNH
jgi:hypothetical protein